MDETADWANYYAQEDQTDTVSNPDPQENYQTRQVRSTSFRSNPDHGALSQSINQRPMPSPSPIQSTTLFADVFESPHKRRKTDDALPPLIRSFDGHQTSPDGHFAIPTRSPNLSFTSSRLPQQAIPRPRSSHGSTHSLDYGALLSPARFSDHDPSSNSKATYGPTSGIASNAFDDLGPIVSTPGNGSFDLLSPRFWTQQSVWPNASIQEACLMRYFVENLAHWVSPSFGNTI